MLVLCVFPIDRDHVRTFQKFLWKDMPGRLAPVRRGAKSLQEDRHKPANASGSPGRQAAETAERAYYTTAQWQVLRLSSKSHWDLPLKIRGSVVHFLVCHPTPPIFDGPEDRNGCRNHDEIRLLANYIDPRQSGYIYADQGHRGGLPADALFVIAGDMNADPTDGDSTAGSIQQLLEHPLINGTCRPTSRGGPEQARRQGGANRQQQGDPALDTADFSDRGPGNLRVDYVLPSRQLTIAAAGVYWPALDDPGYPLVQASDHRLVWVDVE
jgi:endonuclease/exonuclease/phosphatase family metal-dependent hydrolase